MNSALKDDSEYDIFKEETCDDSVSVRSASDQPTKKQKQGFVLQRRWKQHRDILVDYDKIKNGKFTEEEINQVLAILQEFINEFRLTKDEFDKILENSKTYKVRIWPKIAQFFPNRTVKSIYRLIHRTFQTGVTGKWSQADEEKLKVLVNTYGRKWKFIGKQLNRTDYVVRLKYYLMGDINHQFRNKNSWNLDEVIRLMTILYEQSGVQLLKQDYEMTLYNKFGHDWPQTKFVINLRKIQDFDRQVLNILISILQMEQAPLITDFKWNNIALQIQTKNMYDIQRLWKRLKSLAY